MAPKPKKKPASPGYCRWCCSLCCTGFSIWCIIFGLSWPASLDQTIQTKIYQNTIAKPADKDYTDKTFDDLNHNKLAVYLNYHFFNITNPVEVMNGAKPDIMKVGPYSFQKRSTEHKVRYMDDKKIRAGRKVATMEFIPGRSCSHCHLDDVLYIANRVVTAWLGSLKCHGDWGLTDHTTNKKPHKHCKKIAAQGLFAPVMVEELIWGHDEIFGDGVIIRANNGHQVCPPHIPTCATDRIKVMYDPKECSSTKEVGGDTWGGGHGQGCKGPGEFSNFLDSGRIKDTIKRTGYGHEGCMKSLECLYGKIEDCEDCPAKMIIGRAHRMWQMDKLGGRVPPPQVDIGLEGKVGPGFDYNVHKKDVLKGTCSVWKDKDGNCDDNYDDWIKATTTSMFKWYDQTPFDTTDDLAFDGSFKMDNDEAPCKWDGSTNDIAGCPFMQKEDGYGITQPLFHQGRMAAMKHSEKTPAPDLPMFGIMSRRQTSLEFKKTDMVHGIKALKYRMKEKYWKGSEENARFGMPMKSCTPTQSAPNGDCPAGQAKYWQFPGDGMMPLDTQTGGIPFFLSRPHWLGGGHRAEVWNNDMKMRQPSVSQDDWTITYEAVTGLPARGNMKWQMNVMYRPMNARLFADDDMSGDIDLDFSNTTITSGFFTGETVDYSAIGRDMTDCNAPLNEDGTGGGCPLMIPYWEMHLELDPTPYTYEKIKRLLANLKKVGMLKFFMGFWMYGGVIGIVCVFSCMSYHYFASGKKN